MGTQGQAPPRAERRSNPFFLPLVVIGGLMGVLAGYGLLSLIRDHGISRKPTEEIAEAKPAMPQSVAASNPKPTSQPSVAIPKTAPTPTTTEPHPHDIAVRQTETNQPTQLAIDANERNNAKPNRRRNRSATPASEASLKIATNDKSPHSSLALPLGSAAPPLPPPDDPSHTGAMAASASEALSSSSSSNEESSPDSANAVSAIVPLTLRQDVIRVIALPEEVSADSLLCDVGFSPELTDRRLPTGTYDMVVQGLGKRGEYRQELPLHINGAGAVIDIAIRQQNKAAICEIRPKFSLPMSGIKQLTITSGSILQKSLNRTLNNTINAEDALPGMRTRLDDLNVQLDDALAQMNDTGSNVNETGSMRIQARARVHQLQLAITKLNKDIPRAEQLIENKPALETDIADLDQISQYVEKIASNATLSVRFYNGDVTIPATVK